MQAGAESARRQVSFWVRTGCIVDEVAEQGPQSVDDPSAQQDSLQHVG